MKTLKIGDFAPNLELLSQSGVKVALKDFIGKKVILYFYPKDNTPGCMSESCDFFTLYEEFRTKNVVILGINPDNIKSHEEFIQRYHLNQTLLSDENKEVCEAYGVWGLRKNYDKEYEGLICSTFIVDEEDKIVQIYSPVRAKDHALKVLGDL